MTTKPSAADLILAAFDRRQKRGVTAAALAERAGLNLSTARSVLWQLSKSGDVRVVSTLETGERGRPANLYALA